MLDLIGQFHVRIIRAGETVFRQSPFNGIVDEGKDELLDVMFRSSTASTWYCGLINNITLLSASDTMALHTGWSEYTNYDETARQAWSPDAASGKNIINSTLMEFTVDDLTSPTIDGMFITSNSTKSGTTGVLWSTAAFTTPPTVSDGDVIQVSYSLTVN